MAIIISVDASLTSTGLIILDNDKIIKQKLIKSKPIIDGKPIDELRRILKIVDQIDDEIEKEYIPRMPELAVIEGMAFMARNTSSLIQLSALNYFIRAMLQKNNTPFIVVAPTTLKKFVTGKGNSPKDVLMLEVYKRYKVSLDKNDLADSYGLARCGLAVLGLDKKLTQQQKEVVELLKKQL